MEYSKQNLGENKKIISSENGFHPDIDELAWKKNLEFLKIMKGDPTIFRD